MNELEIAMKVRHALSVVKLAALTIASLVTVIFIWPFAAAGMVAFLASGMKFNRWVASGAALIAAILCRMTFGDWPLRIGGGSYGDWYLDVSSGIVNWALAAIVVSAFAHWLAMLVEGCRSAVSKPI